MALVEARDLHTAQEVTANYKQTRAYFRNLGADTDLFARNKVLQAALLRVTEEREHYKQERDHFRAMALDLQTTNGVLIQRLEKLGEPTTPAPAVAIKTPKVTVEQIIKATCIHFNMTRMDLVSQRRTADVVYPRQTAMFLCKQMTVRPLQKIAEAFGGRDHTTVIHAIRRVAILRVADPEPVNKDIAAITQLLVFGADGLERKFP